MTLEDKERQLENRSMHEGSDRQRIHKDKVSDWKNDLPPVYLEQFDSQPCHTQRQLVDLTVEIVTCKYAELIAKHLHANPTFGPVLIRWPLSK